MSTSWNWMLIAGILCAVYILIGRRHVRVVPIKLG